MMYASNKQVITSNSVRHIILNDLNKAPWLQIT